MLLVINNIAPSAVSSYPLPTVTSFVMPLTASFSATLTSFSVPVTTFIGTGNSGITGYLITSTSSTPLASNPNWTSTAPATYTFSSLGSNTVYGWVKDTAGNVSPSVSQTVTIAKTAPANVYYSVGQSSYNLMTGSPTVTISSGAAVFSVAQTGNIGVGDEVIYNSGAATAYISGKSNADRMHWTLVTATGGTPANITNAVVTSITRTFPSLNAAFSGMTDINHINNASLVIPNVIVNLACYYDSRPDTSEAVLTNSLVTGPSNYVNIYTPVSTTAQANYSQRHTGSWTANAYQLNVTDTYAGLYITANYVHVTGLQVLMIVDTATTEHYPRGICLDNLSAPPNGTIVLDSNIVRYQITGAPTIYPIGISFGDNNGATPTAAILNNIVYDVIAGTSGEGIYLKGGIYYMYNNTVYHTSTAYGISSSTTVFYKNNIAQNDTTGYSISSTPDSSSIDNLSDHNDAPGTSHKDSATVSFVNAATRDLHLAGSDTIANGQGTNLSADVNYPFDDDVSGQIRPSAWSIGASEVNLFTITAWVSRDILFTGMAPRLEPVPRRPIATRV